MLDYQLLLPIVALAVATYGVYLQHKQFQMTRDQTAQKKKRNSPDLQVWWRSPQTIVMAIMVVLCWIPYFLNQSTEVSFDGADSMAVVGWGGSEELGPGKFFVTANGGRYFTYRNSYRFMTFCLVYDGLRDELDAPIIGKSAPYDITRGLVRTVIVPPSGGCGPNFGLLLIPRELDPGGFSTVRQAQALGAKFAWKGAAVNPPPSK